MLKITKIRVQRYRSIIDLSLEIDPHENILTICGENNVGKTNALRAINLFFNPNDYDQQMDMPQLKKATWGGSVFPRIDIDYIDTDTNDIYYIVRDIKKLLKDKNNGLSGQKKIDGKGKKIDLTDKELKSFMNKIHFVYVESINLIIPEMIEKISNDVISLEYDKSRFSESKKYLKKSYDTYVDGLQDVLDKFSNDLSNTFKEFSDEWNVRFVVPKNSQKFRDLISDDVTLNINDFGTSGTEEKGSGLQRITLLLLQFEILKRLKGNVTPILFIDEPDIYLHEGMQRKLMDFFGESSTDIQIAYTTHSRIFIDTYKMKNIFLFEANTFKQYSARKKRDINVIDTTCVSVDKADGYDKICAHLGIEQEVAKLLDSYNILVEGESDKKYLSTLLDYFDLPEINIISMNGADNAKAFLNFYNEYYKNIQSKPKVRLLFDNDVKGREVLAKIKKKESTYKNIEVFTEYIPNVYGEILDGQKVNNEVEDFVYPEIICFLINETLKKAGFNTIDSKNVCSQLESIAFKTKGILSLCDHEKNATNPNTGNKISFVSSDIATCQIKKSLSSMFTIQGKKALIKIMEKCSTKYPSVAEFIHYISIPFS